MADADDSLRSRWEELKDHYDELDDNAKMEFAELKKRFKDHKDQ